MFDLQVEIFHEQRRIATIERVFEVPFGVIGETRPRQKGQMKLMRYTQPYMIWQHKAADRVKKEYRKYPFLVHSHLGI